MLCTMCSAALFILLISSNLQSSLSTNLTFSTFTNMYVRPTCACMCVCVGELLSN